MDIIKKVFSTRIAMFVIIAVALMTFSFFQNITTFPQDAYNYWHGADSVFNNGFNILYFPSTFRGCLFQILVGMIKHIVIGLGIPDYWGWRFLMSIMISGILVYAFPTIFKKTSPIGWTAYLTNAIFILILIIFWGDFIQYPLSDLPACAFLIAGIAILVWVKDKPNRIHKIIGGIIAGALLYAAYNTRVAFLYGVLIAVIVFTIYIMREKSYRNFLVLISLIIGMSLTAAPQMMINHEYVGSWSPKVYTESFTGYQKRLEELQIFWGLHYPRYETYLGNEEDFPSQSVYFVDHIGSKIVEREGITKEEFSYITIIKLFLKYPLDIGGLYIRHLISLMTPIFNQIFITDLHTGKGIFISLAIILWLIAAVDILLDYKNKFDNLTLCMLTAMVFPALLQLAGAPELRFFLIVYLLLYYYVSNVIDYKKLFQSIKRRWMPILIVCTAVYFMWISYVGMLLSSNSETVFLINDNHYECFSEIE